MTAWLGVVSADHVARGVALGIAQIGHGKKGGLARMHAGDLLGTGTLSGPSLADSGADGRASLMELSEGGKVAISLPSGETRTFLEDGDELALVSAVPLVDVQDVLDLCRVPNWGYQLRRGLVALSDHDAGVLRAALVGVR